MNDGNCDDDYDDGDDDDEDADEDYKDGTILPSDFREYFILFFFFWGKNNNKWNQPSKLPLQVQTNKRIENSQQKQQQ